MKARNVVPALIVLLAVGYAIYFFSVGIKISDDSATYQSADAPTAPTADASKRQDEAETTIAVKPPRPLTMLDRYVQSTDLLDLVSQLRADADAGDADAARMIAKAYGECSPYVAIQKLLDVETISRFQTEPARSIALAQRAKQLQRCNGFIATGLIKSSVVREVEARAAALNDDFAKVIKLGEELSARRRDESGPYELSTSEIDFVHGVALSKDVEAISALSYLEVERYPAHAYAWQLVACDLGRDCGSNGYVMRQQCLLFGQCVAGNFRELIRRKFLAPDQFDVAQAREREILQAIRSGDVSGIIP